MARRKTSTTAPHTITAIPQLGTMKSLRVTGISVVDSGKAVDSSVVDEGIEGISVDEVDTVFVSNEHNITVLDFHKYRYRDKKMYVTL